MLTKKYKHLIKLCNEYNVPITYDRKKMFLHAIYVRYILGIGLNEYVRDEYYGDNGKGLKAYYLHNNTHHSYPWIMCDFVLCRIIYALRIDEYFRNEFFDLRWGARNEFLTYGKMLKMMDLCNMSTKVPDIDNKEKFNHTFSSFLKRRWIDMEKISYEEFEDFANSVTTGFLKYSDGLQGIGAKKVDFEKENLKKVYENYYGKRIVIEELVQQHHELAEFNESTVNTIRVVTFRCVDDTIIILGAAIRIGRSNQVADNFHMNGLAADIDVDTGVVSGRAVDARGNRFLLHPDSGKIIPGYKIPQWEIVKQEVRKAAQSIPEVRYVGWDVAIREDDICFIEGNSDACPDVLEMTVRRGVWKKLKPLVEAVAKGYK